MKSSKVVPADVGRGGARGVEHEDVDSRKLLHCLQTDNQQIPASNLQRAALETLGKSPWSICIFNGNGVVDVALHFTTVGSSRERFLPQILAMMGKASVCRPSDSVGSESTRYNERLTLTQPSWRLGKSPWHGRASYFQLRLWLNRDHFHASGIRNHQ